METTIAILTERVTVLAQKVTDLKSGHKELGDEFRNYRHEIRSELQKITQEIDHMTYDREIKIKEFDRLTLMVEGLRQRFYSVDSGVTVVGYIWRGSCAIILLVIAWGLGKYGH